MISGNLEYLMTSLPYLKFQNDREEKKRVLNTLSHYSNLNEDELKSVSILEHMAEPYLSKKDYQIFKAVDLQNIHRSDFRKNRIGVLSEFASYRLSLKENIEQLRLSRQEQTASTVESNTIFEGLIGSPLDNEIYLMKRQWDKLEQLSVEHYSDFSALLIYKLKLLLLERYWSFNQERGFKIFLDLTTN